MKHNTAPNRCQRHLLWLCCLFLFATSAAWAQAQPTHNPTSRCEPTITTLKSGEYPGKDKIPTTNNLRGKPGSLLAADGFPLLITGQVLDKDCVPVEGAIIEIWQTNSEGKYVAGKPTTYGQKQFLGAGQTTTDNQGRYAFYSIYPRGYNNLAPHIHFMVRKSGYQTIQTDLFFAYDPANEKAVNIRRLSDKAKTQLIRPLYPPQTVSGDYRVDFPIVLRERETYRGL